jgi:hypothetical protein
MAEEKQKRWEHKLDEVRHITDGLGKPIDSGIRETVAILQLIGLHTTASCEGHLDWGLPVPWIRFHAPEARALRPELSKLNDALDTLEQESAEFERVLTQRNALQEQVEELKARDCLKLFPYLDAYYSTRIRSYDERLIIDSSGRLIMQGVCIQVGRDRVTRVQKLKVYQREMKSFTEFLKKLYL